MFPASLQRNKRFMGSFATKLELRDEERYGMRPNMLIKDSSAFSSPGNTDSCIPAFNQIGLWLAASLGLGLAFTLRSANSLKTSLMHAFHQMRPTS